MHQLIEVAMARCHKTRAFELYLDRLPPLTSRASQRAGDGLERRRYECLPPINPQDNPEQPPPCI